MIFCKTSVLQSHITCTIVWKASINNNIRYSINTKTSFCVGYVPDKLLCYARHQRKYQLQITCSSHLIPFNFLANSYCLKSSHCKLWKRLYSARDIWARNSLEKCPAWSRGLHIRSSFWIGQAFKLQLIFGHIVVKFWWLDVALFLWNAAHF